MEIETNKTKKNILITGVSSGLGRELALHLKTDFHVVGLSRRYPEIVGIERYECDLTSNLDLKRFYKNVENVRFDAILFNAGVGYFDHFPDISSQENMQMLKTNVLSPIKILSHLYKQLNDKCAVIFIGSKASKKFMKYGAVYQATKFGLRGFAGAFRNESPQFRVHFINPKIIQTEFHNHTKIAISKSYGETKISEITSCIDRILNGEGMDFEIDL